MVGGGAWPEDEGEEEGKRNEPREGETGGKAREGAVNGWMSQEESLPN